MFAQKGFKGTTVAEIEAASGLKPGSGALFAHFPTKEALFEAAIEERAVLNQQGQSLFDLARIGDLRAELTVFVRAWLMGLDINRDFVLVWLTESRNFPQLRPLMDQEVNQPAVNWLAGYLRGKVKARELADHDCEAVAVVAICATTAWWLGKQVGGDDDPSVGEDRFVYGLVDLLLRMAPAPSKRKTQR